MEGAVDAHQHYWDPKQTFPLDGSWFFGAVGYPWRQVGLPQLDRAFLPEDLGGLIESARVAKTVAVQAIHGSGETEWLLRLAEQHENIAGVVGWLDLRQPSELVERDLTHINHPRLVGIRHMAQFESDKRWLLRSEVVGGLQVLARAGMAFDLLITPDQLTHVPELSDAVPDLDMVIDHLAKPPIRTRALEPWASRLRLAASNPRLYCKLSGMVTEADHAKWQVGDLLPYIEVALEAFGPDRLIFGSDWPVCMLAGSYQQVYDALSDSLDALLGPQARTARHGIYCTNAVRFYHLDRRSDIK